MGFCAAALGAGLASGRRAARVARGVERVVPPALQIARQLGRSHEEHRHVVAAGQLLERLEIGPGVLLGVGHAPAREMRAGVLARRAAFVRPQRHGKILRRLLHRVRRRGGLNRVRHDAALLDLLGVLRRRRVAVLDVAFFVHPFVELGGGERARCDRQQNGGNQSLHALPPQRLMRCQCSTSPGRRKGIEIVPVSCQRLVTRGL